MKVEVEGHAGSNEQQDAFADSTQGVPEFSRQIAHLMEANFPSHGERVSALARAFYHVVRSSGTFSWLGLFDAEDQLHRPRLVVYVANGLHPSAEALQANPPTDIGPALTELSLAIQPNRFLDLYYVNPDDNGKAADAALDDIHVRYGSNDHKPRVLWSEDIGQGPDGGPARVL